MTDLGTLESPKAAPPSTVLDAPKNTDAMGGGAPKLSPEPEKAEPKSAAETLREVFKESGKDEAPAEKEVDDSQEGEEVKEVKEEKKPAKPAKEAKEDVKEPDEGDDDNAGEDEEKPAKAREKDGKFAPREHKEDRGNPADDAPKSFQADAKEKWANVPNTVKRDINRMIAEHTESSERSRVATERYERIRDFDELAQSHGRDLRDSLMRVHEIENELQRNPISGLNRILLEAGPKKADGQPVSLYELAQFIVSKGQQGYQQLVAQPAQQSQQPQANPEVEQLKRQIEQMQQQQIAASVIEPFKQSHPRYNELEDAIAKVLKSDMIGSGYTPAERLEIAYDMAARLNPASHVEEEAEEGRVAESFAGSKSIKSAPGAVSSEMELERGGSIRDILEQERKRLRRS